MSRTNETRHIEWHETCKCKCRLEASVCNNRQKWNKNKRSANLKKNWLIKADVIKDSSGTPVSATANAMNNVA